MFCPPGDTVRPVLGRLKESIFSSLGDLEGMSVLDLFSGIGSLGIESISRGASYAAFVERDKEALRHLRKNIRHLELEDKTKIYPLDVYDYLSEIHCFPGTYQVVFIDPPYDRGDIARLAGRIDTILTLAGLIVVKHSVREEVDWGIEPLKVLKRGDDRMTILRGGA
jgi:16S rRNA (guanine966-N2)-methyltransferase